MAGALMDSDKIGVCNECHSKGSVNNSLLFKPRLPPESIQMRFL